MGNETNIGVPLPADKVTERKNKAEGLRAGVLTPNGAGFKTAYMQEYGNATRGQCPCCSPNGAYPTIIAGNDSDKVVWDQTKYAFLSSRYGAAGTSKDFTNNDALRVHPTLWNNGTNNVLSGVFEVLPGKIYQVRGYDMANISFVKSNNLTSSSLSSGDHWLVMDTLMSQECTEAALELFQDFLQKTVPGYTLKGNIYGIIISHSHVDHYGGMKAVSGYFPNTGAAGIVVPQGFDEAATSENVYVGNAMGRRASYQYGSFIKPKYTNAKTDAGDYLSGSISIGIGQGQSTGTIGYCAPTEWIAENGETTIDELTIQCQLTPGTEAPAEMNNYFPAYKALWLAENCSGTLHNLYTLRGAQVRDGKAWAKFLVETAVKWGGEAEVIFQSHNWPHWRNAEKQGQIGTDLYNFLIDTASVYKYINDQTLLYMNMGYKMNEASDMLTLPRTFRDKEYLLPFYGTPKHNAKAVYQKYLGWYDANPLHLEELPPEQMAKEQLRYLTYNGDVLDLVKTDIANGNYWTAAYFAHQVVLGSTNTKDVIKAKQLCAQALEQLGYQCESGTWRNAYLSAAYELRFGKARISAESSADMVSNMTPEMLLDYISILYDGERTADRCSEDRVIKITDNANNPLGYFKFIIKNGAILYYELPYADNTALAIKKSELISLIANSQSASVWSVKNKALEASNTNKTLLQKLLGAMTNLTADRFRYFDIMDRHDSSVKFDDDNKYYDLHETALDCLTFLAKKCVPVGKPTYQLTGPDLTTWQNYRKILFLQSRVMLEGDFIKEDDNGNYGIGEDGLYVAEEYWYAMYSLYHYLGNGYLKNDCGYEGTDVDRFTGVKKILNILEGYVAAAYLRYDRNNPKTVVLKEGDRLALNWLDSSLNLENANITTAKLFMLLSQYYDEFLYSLNITTKKYFPQGKFTERGERL